jgi:formylglycine-generating enzyme required for sulfatase activity
MDTHEVTNADFQEFVDATGYITTAEQAVDWEELKNNYHLIQLNLLRKFTTCLFSLSLCTSWSFKREPR